MSGISNLATVSDSPGVRMEDLPCPIVGIGASAGSVETLKAFFAGISENCGLAFVVVQPFSADHHGALAEMLAGATLMPVLSVTEPVEPAVGRIYVIAPGTVLGIRDGILTPTSAQEAGGQRLIIDCFFRSLAAARRENAVGIVLSGSGSDGTLGLQSIKKFGGLTLVQSPDSCRFDSMPKSALAAGVVDQALAVEDMGTHLVSHFAYRAQTAPGTGDQDEITGALPAIFRLLDESLGHDFSRYKQSTLIRRIRRRMQMLRINPVEAYAEVLGKDPKEAEQLFKDLIIGVTEFFRDPEAFDVLASVVLPKLFEQIDAAGTLRVWVAGCATGEEAYSIAILLREHMAQTGESHPVQIFATDIDADAVEVARQGFYKEEIREHVSEERLARFFSPREGGYQIHKEVREMCIFSVHNLIHDPPFSRMNLVVCRNVLIYFDASLQQRILPLFRYALNPRGFLFLGPAESVGTHGDFFHPVEKRLRIFQTIGASPIPTARFPRLESGRTNRVASDTTLKVKLARERDAREIHERALLDWYVPPSVLIDGEGEVLHFVRHTARFLQPPVGSPSHNIFDIVRDDLRIILRAALTQARKDGQEIVKRKVPLSVEEGVRRIALVVRPVKGAENGLERFLVLFREEAEVPADEDEPAPPRAEEVEAVQQLEKELRVTRQWLQTTVEELENSNEELKSSNEELISINEEYQSANEALQTSKEELQSLNEELETVNTELSKKIEELDHTNADMRSLFAATGIATIFFDDQLRIKRFTPAASELFSLVETDFGRPLEDIAARFDPDKVIQAMRKVVGGGSAPDFEIRKPGSNAHFICRVTPCPGPGGVKVGAVVNFIDVTELKLAQAALQDAAQRKDEFLALLGHELRNPLAPLKMGLEVLKRADTSAPDTAEIHTMLGRQVDHLTKIVDELLDVTRISRGLILLRKEPLDLIPLVEAAVSDYRAIFQAQSLALEVAATAEPLWIDGDRTRICQVVANLLQNAAKFTPPGGRVSVTLQRDGEFGVVTVQDSGRGLDAPTMARLFQPFSQGDTSIDRQGAGLGLGLALVKGLLDLHRGSISVSSAGPGEGSTFVVRLPLTERRPGQAVAAPRAPYAPRRIVIIEDNEDAARALAHVLTASGHTVEVANESRAGIAAVERLRADAVICDIGLPGELDGYGICRRLRELHSDRPLLLVALTGYGQDRDKHRAVEAGFDHHFTKPMGVEQIMTVFGWPPAD